MTAASGAMASYETSRFSHGVGHSEVFVSGCQVFMCAIPDLRVAAVASGFSCFVLQGEGIPIKSTTNNSTVCLSPIAAGNHLFHACPKRSRCSGQWKNDGLQWFRFGSWPTSTN